MEILHIGTGLAYLEMFGFLIKLFIAAGVVGVTIYGVWGFIKKNRAPNFKVLAAGAFASIAVILVFEFWALDIFVFLAVI